MIPTAMDLRYVLARIDDLDKALSAATRERHEILVGGGVAMMSHVAGRQTTDIDALHRTLGRELAAAARGVAATHGLPDDWLNNDAARYLPDVDLSESAVLFHGNTLTVRVLDPEPLLAMKLLAGRDRDIGDIVVLMDATGRTTEHKLRALLADMFGARGDLTEECSLSHSNIANAVEEYRLQHTIRSVRARPPKPSRTIDL